MKTNSSFKLSKQSKIFCANILDPIRRGLVRRSFIEAEIMQHIQPRLSKQRKEDTRETNDA